MAPLSANEEALGSDPFAKVLALAGEANYLGSTVLMSELLTPVMNLTLDYLCGEASFNEVWGLIWETSGDMAAAEKYVPIAGWHTPQGLGVALQRYFQLKDEPIADGALHHIISEALMAISLRARDLINGYLATPELDLQEHLTVSLECLRTWASYVFIGINEDTHPGVTIANFVWDAQLSSK